MPRQLTPQQLKFIAAIQSGVTGVQAAIEAGYAKGSAKNAAYHLMHKNELVMAELARQRKEVSLIGECNAEKFMERLMGAAEFARKTNNANALIRSEELIGKHAGHLKDKLDVNVTGTFDLVGVLAEARARVLRPRCDPALMIEGEFEALPSPESDGPIDSQSTGRVFDDVDLFS